MRQKRPNVTMTFRLPFLGRLGMANDGDESVPIPADVEDLDQQLQVQFA